MDERFEHNNGDYLEETIECEFCGDYFDSEHEYEYNGYSVCLKCFESKMEIDEWLEKIDKSED
jgi:formylmethanofuran dehydrogenase subunit E